MSITEQLSKIESSEIVVPEFQREYVWTKQQAKSLFESLYKKWPTGGFLFWRVKKNEAPALKNVEYSAEDTDRIDLILDGQQRLTALYLLIKDKVPPYYSKEDIKYDPKGLHFNILSETFQYYQKTLMKNDPSWNKLSWYYNCNETDIDQLCDKLEKIKNKRVSSKIWRVYSKIKNILEHEYPVQTIPEGVGELIAITIFDKINTQGTKLSSEELALAHIQNNWKNARREMKNYSMTLKTQRFDFDLSFYVRCLTAVVSHGGRPVTMHTINQGELVEGWEKVKKSLDYLIKILPTEVYIDSSQDLISPRTLIPMVAFLSKNNYFFTLKQKAGFLRWFYLATLWSIYSSSPVSKMDRNIRTVFEKEDPVPDLIEDIGRQRAVLTVSPKDFESSRLNSGFGKLALIVAKYNKAKDWFIGTPLSGGGSGFYSIEQHHIFPASVLYNEKYPSKTWNERDKVNEIANKAFITKKTNREIRNSKPVDYFNGVLDKFPQALKSQFVPDDRNLWKIDNYESFLEARRRLLASAINGFIESFNENNLKRLTISDLLKNDEGQYLEFKSTLKVDTQGRGIPVKKIEEQSLKTIAAFLNQDEGGILIIGVDDDNNPVGLEHDYNTLGRKKDADGFVLHLTNIIKSRLGQEYIHNVDISIEKYKGVDVAVIRVQKAKEFVYLEGRNYVRVLNQTDQLNPADTTEYILRVWRT